MSIRVRQTDVGQTLASGKPDDAGETPLRQHHKGTKEQANTHQAVQ